MELCHLSLTSACALPEHGPSDMKGFQFSIQQLRLPCNQTKNRYTSMLKRQEELHYNTSYMIYVIACSRFSFKLKFIVNALSE